MGYVAQSDPIFCDGFYVEDHDLRNWTDVAEPLRRIVESEAKAGNKSRTRSAMRNPIALTLV
ncbi:MAG: hypothetical protein DCE87_06905 [Betaproteobacteria bacterium]|jgi:hypothetical protein|nr:MAG: hypothetical protein DCE87_06905 [Betaproteobacteria bacterium]